MVRLDVLVRQLVKDVRERMDEERTGGAEPPAKVARGLSRAKESPARGEPGCEWSARAILALRQRREMRRDTGRPVGQGK